MTYSTPITQKGQMTLSAEVRRKLGIKPGERVRVSVEENRIIVERDTYWEDLTALRQKAAKHLKQKGLYGLSIEELNKRKAEARSQENI